MVQSVSLWAVTLGTCCSLHTAVTAGQPRASLLSGAPGSLVTPIRAIVHSVTHLHGLETPAGVSTEELAMVNVTVLASLQTLGLVRAVLAVSVVVTHPASSSRNTEAAVTW